MRSFQSAFIELEADEFPGVAPVGELGGGSRGAPSPFLRTGGGGGAGTVGSCVSAEGRSYAWWRPGEAPALATTSRSGSSEPACDGRTVHLFVSGEVLMLPLPLHRFERMKHHSAKFWASCCCLLTGCIPAAENINEQEELHQAA